MLSKKKWPGDIFTSWVFLALNAGTSSPSRNFLPEIPLTIFPGRNFLPEIQLTISPGRNFMSEIPLTISPGRNFMPEFRFAILLGWQNHPLNQGIKMQGMQNLPRNPVGIFAGSGRMAVKIFRTNRYRLINGYTREKLLLLKENFATILRKKFFY